MRWPIRNQILIPVTSILAIAVLAITVSSSWLAVRNGEQRTIQQLGRVVRTLREATFPYTDRVLKQMRGLSGAEFAVIGGDGRVRASTLAAPFPKDKEKDLLEVVPRGWDVASLSRFPSIRLAETHYFAARLPANRPVGQASLLVFYPVRRWRAARWEAAWPPLAIGGVTGVLMAFVSIWLSRRLGRRIQTVQELFARIVEGNFDHADPDPVRDELHELVVSANQLSDQLQQMRQTIRHTERMRLLAQLSGGMAHQLRNAVTGARMAVQLHQRRCQQHSPKREGELRIALRQLELTEEHIKGLLALGRPQRQSATPGRLSDLLRDVEQLVEPACRHARVRWECEIPGEASRLLIKEHESVRSALLNLVLNGVEAAGSAGMVRVRTSLGPDGVFLEITDSGDGPPTELQESLFEPFVTSKKEGSGLGLALARQIAETLGGTLSCSREEGLTTFSISLPPSAIVPQERRSAALVVAPVDQCESWRGLESPSIGTRGEIT